MGRLVRVKVGVFINLWGICRLYPAMTACAARLKQDRSGGELAPSPHGIKRLLRKRQCERNPDRSCCLRTLLRPSARLRTLWHHLIRPHTWRPTLRLLLTRPRTRRPTLRLLHRPQCQLLATLRTLHNLTPRCPLARIRTRPTSTLHLSDCLCFLSN